MVIVIMNFLLAEICSGAYYGKLIGKLSELQHGVSGEVYAVDARTLFIKDFTYDGEGPGWYISVAARINLFSLRNQSYGSELSCLSPSVIQLKKYFFIIRILISSNSCVILIRLRYEIIGMM